MIRELFRALHTIKGLSAMVGVEPVVELSHEMESLLRVRDQTSSPLSSGVVELLFQGVRAIGLRVKAFGENKRVEPAAQDLLASLHGLQAETRQAELDQGPSLSIPADVVQKLTPGDREHLVQGLIAGGSAYRIDFAPSPANAAAGISITSVRERVSNLGEIVKVVPRALPKTPAAPTGLIFTLLVLSTRAPEQLAEAAHCQTSDLVPITLVATQAVADDSYDSVDNELADLTQASSHDTIRVEVSRLDDALEKLAALVVTRYRLERAVRALRDTGADTRALEAILGEHRRELSRMRASLTHARMVSMQQLLERVPLLVRGMSRDSNKQIELRIDATRAELDKAVAERVFPALLHLVRNAIDHAIEPSDERTRLGKPPAGVVTVRCFERAGNQLELSVSDDGSGIDAQRVARKAGVALPEDDRALLALITRPGLSTRESADERSGRGMGMDIVKRVAVGLLGGELSMSTELGRGTTFTLRLPTSISILDTFKFRCGTQSYVVPLAMVEEVIELDASKVVSAPTPHGHARSAQLLRRKGENIPLFELAMFFRTRAEETRTATSAVVPGEGLRSALVVSREGERFAFTVDHMLGQQEVVVKPLEDPLVKVPGITGSTDLGDGLPTLVLDLWALSRAPLRRARLAIQTSDERREVTS
jgi:two-component system chemotaxis sensor kinase CheA